MLFNSFEFLFGFLPITLVVYLALVRWRFQYALGWLTAASLFFYGWWSPPSLLLLVGSLVINYGCARLLGQRPPGSWSRRGLLTCGVMVNLAVIGVYKYSGFFLQTVNDVAGTSWSIPHLVLPIGISFYTFQQIAYLIDRDRDLIPDESFLRYALFVTFFPQLIAGPIVHPLELLPQFRAETNGPRTGDTAIGATLFFFGLFKKCVLADGVAVHASLLFGGVHQGAVPTLLESWFGALAYTLQLYFDFSGYSDMAVGLGCLFGVRLPVNFDSPYQATSIVDFWRRWHLTLSRFLRDYVYFALGGSRHGRFRKSINLLLTMLLGGLWHGAGWTFLLWGGLHGLYLVINHAWVDLSQRLGWTFTRDRWWGRHTARGVTFLAVVIGWVIFRAPTLGEAQAVLVGMTGWNGIVCPSAWMRDLNHVGLTGWLMEAGVQFETTPLFRGWKTVLHVAALLAVVWACPNTQTILALEKPQGKTLDTATTPSWLHWEPSPRWAFAGAVITLIALLHLSQPSEFLYFQF